MNKYFLFFLPFVFISCASHIKLDSKFCSKAGQWLNENAVVEDYTDQKSFDENFQIITGTGPKPFSLRDLLRDRNIKCENLTSLMVSVESDSVDAVLSILPFFVFKQLRIRGTYYYNEAEESQKTKEKKKLKKEMITSEENDEFEALMGNSNEEDSSLDGASKETVSEDDESDEGSNEADDTTEQSDSDEEEEGYIDPDPD